MRAFCFGSEQRLISTALEAQLLHKGGSGGGGGSSGAVKWPQYMMESHRNWLYRGITGIGQDYDEASTADTETGDVSLNQALFEAWDNSPYSQVAAYDPSALLSALETVFSTVDASVQGLDPDADWLSFFDAAKAKIDASIGDTEIDAAVAAYDDRNADVLAKNVSRMAAQYADINAVNGSAYAFAHAFLLYQHARETSRFNAQLSAQQHQQKGQLYLQAADQMRLLQNQKVMADLQFLQNEAERTRLTIIAEKEQTDTEIELTIGHERWNLTIWAHGTDLLAGIQGGTVSAQEQPQSTRMSALGGALSGGAQGALAGAAAGGPVGATVGGVLGATAGFLGS